MQSMYCSLMVSSLLIQDETFRYGLALVASEC